MTPACAGTTKLQSLHAELRPDDPRVRGDDTFEDAPWFAQLG